MMAAATESKRIAVDHSEHLDGLVARGMPLHEALTRAAGTALLEADETHYREVFDGILESMLQRSPIVEEAGLGCVYVSLDGLNLLYGNDALLATMLHGVIPHGFDARLGIGENKFVAYLAAQQADTGGSFKAPNDAKQFVQAFFIDQMPVSSEAMERLHQLGLHRIGDLVPFHLGPMQAQFGPEGRLIWELAQGIDSRVLTPLQQEERITERIELPYASVSLDMLTLGLEMLLKRAFARPEMRGRFVGKAAVECGVIDAPAWSRTYAFKEGLGSPELALSAIKARLTTDPPQRAIEEVSLALSDFTGEPSAQGGILRNTRDSSAERLVDVDRRLQPHLNGSPALYRVVDVAPDHPLPEMRVVQVPIDPSAAQRMKPLNLPAPIPARLESGSTVAVTPSVKRKEQIAAIEDSWTVDLWWWAPQPAKRDYYRLCLADNTTMTVFHDPLAGKWYRQNY